MSSTIFDARNAEQDDKGDSDRKLGTGYAGLIST